MKPLRKKNKTESSHYGELKDRLLTEVKHSWNQYFGATLAALIKTGPQKFCRQLSPAKG